jgi:2-iminoacetate synthase ThiH
MTDDFIMQEPRARRTDQQTSHEAAAKAGVFIRGQGKRIYNYLQSIHPNAANPEEIGRHTGMTVVQVDRLRKLMVDAGMVEVVGVGKMTNGYHAGLWRSAP